MAQVSRMAILAAAVVALSSCTTTPQANHSGTGGGGKDSDSSGCPAGASTQFLQRMSQDAPSAQVASEVCREGYAYVLFTGPGVGVHGTQAAFFQLQADRWVDIAWGETSHGEFTYDSLEVERPDDAARLRELFPDVLSS